MPEYKLDGRGNRMIAGEDDDAGTGGSDDGGGSGTKEPGKSGKNRTALALAAIMLFGMVAAGTYVATRPDDTETVAEDTQDEAATETTADDDAADSDTQSDTDDDMLAEYLDAVGKPIITLDDIGADHTTASGDVTLFGAMDGALRAVNTDPSIPPYYPVAWGGMECDVDGSADSWFFSMAQAGQSDLSVWQVDVARDGAVTVGDLVNGAEYGFESQAMFGSYPPDGMNSPDLWLASPHPTDCPSWENRGVSFYWCDDRDVPVVVFAGNDPACYPDGPMWIETNPITGEELEPWP